MVNIIYEFQPQICLLSDASSPMSNRFKIMQKNAEIYKNDQDKDTQIYDKKYAKQYIYGMLPVELIPAAYIPFRYDDIESNFYRLSKNNKIQAKYYKEIFENVSDDTLDEKNGDKDKIKNELRKYLKDNLNNPRSSFYTVEIESIMLYEILAFWLILLLILMKIFYTYYSSIYSYVMFLFFIIILLFAILWKMFYTLQ